MRLAPDGAVREDTYALGERERITSSSLGNGRVAAVIGSGYRDWYGSPLGCSRCAGARPGDISEPAQLLALGGLDTGRFVAGRLSVASQPDPWWAFWGAPAVYAVGTRALVHSQVEAAVLDLSDPATPRFVSRVPLAGTPERLHASGNRVLLALREQGVQYVDLY